MTYWLLTTEYPPFFGGGISTYCGITARQFADKGHQVTVFVNDNTVRDFVAENDKGVRIIRFNPSRTNSSSFLGHVTNISYEFAHIVKHFVDKEGKPDIIEAQEYLGIAYYLLQYKYQLYDWCRDIPVVITMHSPSFLYMEYNHIPMYRYPNYWICEMERFCLQAANHIISPSQYMLRELRERFELTNQHITVVPNPFSIKDGADRFAASQPSPGQIVFYGKLTAQKGAFKLLAYFEKLWKEGFDRPLYLLGGQDIVYHAEGIAMGDLIRKKYRKYLNAGLLIMEDRIPPSEIAGRLAAAEVVIVPSNNDNLPYVVFEMMALGKLLLISKQGGHTEVIREGEEGFIFDHEQPETLGKQLHHILNLNSVERNRISTNAVKRVIQDYNPNIIYEQKIKVLSEVIEKHSSQSILFPFVRPQDQKENIPSATDSHTGKLSIVIPYFNMGQYIEETVKSVQQSEYADKEIIIINDGSNESDSISKLEQFRHQAGIQVIDMSNQGLANARNYGAEKATGEYLAFLDADDTVAPDYYTKAVRILRHYPNVHFAGCWTQYFGDSSKKWPGFLPEPPLILYHNLVNSSSLFYKRNSFLSAGLNDPKMVFAGMEDYASVVALLANGLKGIVMPELLFRYRVRPNSMIRAISREKKLFLHQYIATKNKSFYANFAAEIFNLMNANGPAILLDNPSLDHHLADRLPFGGKVSLRIINLIKSNKYAKSIAYKLYRFLKK